MLGLALEPGVPETPPARWRARDEFLRVRRARGGEHERRGARAELEFARRDRPADEIAAAAMKFATLAAPLLLFPRAPSPRLAANRVLLDFTDASVAPLWRPVDDRIMGGSSTSLITHSDGATTFSGDLIVEGGGFASARFERPFELGRDVEALELDAEGDGRLGYKLTLRSAAADASISYQYALPALTAQTSLRLPLSGFRATCRGQPAPDAPPLRAEDVCGLGLMLSRYEVAGGVKESIPAGAFCLTLRRLSTAESELAINGRRWLRPRGPSMCAAAAADGTLTLADCEAAAARLGCALRPTSVGPAFRVELAWEGGRALAGGDPAQPELLGYSEGFSQPTGCVHLESLQVRRFSGYWSRQRRDQKARYDAAPRPSDQSLGVLLSAAVACWILERDPFKCGRAQLLAINDNPRQGRVLARYYRRLGFATLREVGDEGGMRDFADQVVWGGVGTLMEVDVRDFVARWGGAVREMAPAAEE